MLEDPDVPVVGAVLAFSHVDQEQTLVVEPLDPRRRPGDPGQLPLRVDVEDEDSLNHLGRFEQWEAVFDRAREHLAAGGVFVFDVNTERKLARIAGAPPWIQWFDDESLFLIDVREGEDGTYDWNVRVFEHAEASTYRLHAEDIRERAFPSGRIEAALDERFARVSISDAERARPTARSERLYFVCR